MDVDALGVRQGYLGAEFLAHDFIADDKIGVEYIALAPFDDAAQAPREEFGIFINFGDKAEKLFWRIGEVALFDVPGHAAVSFGLLFRCTGFTQLGFPRGFKLQEIVARVV